MQCLLFLQKQTLFSAVAMSALCQKRKSAASSTSYSRRIKNLPAATTASSKKGSSRR